MGESLLQLEACSLAVCQSAPDTLQMSKLPLHLTWAAAGLHLKAAFGRHRQSCALGAMGMAVGCVGLASSTPRLYLPGLYCLQGDHQLPAKDTPYTWVQVSSP